MNARSLERTLRNHLANHTLEETAQLIREQTHIILTESNQLFSDKSLAAFKKRRDCRWPDGSGSYYSHENSDAIGRYRKKHYTWELELLSAKHPTRVARLWSASVDRLAKRYGRSFENRLEFAIAGGIYHRRENLLEAIQSMDEAFEFLQTFESLGTKVRGKGDAILLCQDYHVSHVVREGCDALLTLVSDFLKPQRLYDGVYCRNGIVLESKQVDLVNISIPLRTFSENGSHSFFPAEMIKYMNSLLLSHAAGKVDVKRALHVLYGEQINQAGMKREFYAREVPAVVDFAARATIKRAYDGQKGKVFERFLSWLSDAMLERWKVTAADHERVFDFHTPDFYDSKLIQVFHEIRSGKKVAEDDSVIIDGRLPKALALMMNDSLVSFSDVVPPIGTYPSRREMEEQLTNRVFVKSILDRVVPHAAIVERSVAGLLTNGEMNSVLANATDLSNLAGIIDPKKLHYILFSGDHTLFVAEREFYPSGTQKVGQIYTFSKLASHITQVSDGAQVRIHGQPFVVKKTRSHSNYNQANKCILDVDVDIIPVKSYTVVIDIGVDEFKRDYYKDFLAHVLIHRPHIDALDLHKELACIDKYVTEVDPCDISIKLGYGSGHTDFTTFHFGERIGFSLSCKHSLVSAEIIAMAKSLTSYLTDVGLSFHQHIDLDETGRAIIAEKKKARAFSEKHLDEIVSALSGYGLRNALAHVLTDKKYNLSHLNTRAVCEDCGREYLFGLASREDLKEQWHDGLHFDILHSISCHPHTYSAQLGDLEKVHRLILDVKPYVPLFVRVPDVVLSFEKLRKVSHDHCLAADDSMNYWQTSEGGLHAEPEEIAASRRLQRIAAYEKKIHAAERETKRKLTEVALDIQSQYDNQRPKAKKEEDYVVVNRWLNQLLIYDMYRLTEPVLVPAIAK